MNIEKKDIVYSPTIRNYPNQPILSLYFFNSSGLSFSNRMYLYSVVLLAISNTLQITSILNFRSSYNYFAFMAFFCASADSPFGFPPIVPLALALASPTLVLSEIIFLSNSANPPTT
jgi:hypothetical protein